MDPVHSSIGRLDPNALRELLWNHVAFIVHRKKISAAGGHPRISEPLLIAFVFVSYRNLTLSHGGPALASSLCDERPVFASGIAINASSPVFRCAGQRENAVIQFLRRLASPAGESQMALALGFAALVLSLMLWAVLWQASVISYQRELIRWLWVGKFGG